MGKSCSELHTRGWSEISSIQGLEFSRKGYSFWVSSSEDCTVLGHIRGTLATSIQLPKG